MAADDAKPVPEPATPHLIARSTSRILAQLAEVEEARLRLVDQEELRGPTVLLRAAGLSLNAALRLLTADSSVADQGEAAKLLSRSDRVRDLMLWLEGAVGPPLRVVSRLHGTGFEPFVAPFLRLARSVDSGSEVVFVPQEKSTYGLTPPFLPTLAQGAAVFDTGLGQALSELPDVRCITYPATSETDIFQLPLIGHEIAHLLLSRDNDSSGSLESALFDEALAATNAQLDPSDQAQSWFVELACDLVALHMLGPAFAFALYEHSVLNRGRTRIKRATGRILRLSGAVIVSIRSLDCGLVTTAARGLLSSPSFSAASLTRVRRLTPCRLPNLQWLTRLSRAYVRD